MLKTTSGWNLLYWTKHMVHKNFGDYLGQVYFDIAGIKSQDCGRPCLMIGTVLHQHWWDKAQLPLHIWGSGSCGYDFPQIRKTDNILSVRGPLTKAWLDLPEDVPLGDPALLLPRLYSPRKCNLGPIKVFNYDNFQHGTSTRIMPSEWKKLVDSIANAEIVLANTLHASMVAQAYGVPWAVYQFNDNNPLPLRWRDWFAYLGLPDSAHQSVDNVEDAYSWWEKWGREIEKPSMSGMIDKCPWKKLKRIIK